MPIKIECLIGEENLIKWLNGKINKFGLLVGNVKITPRKPIYFRKGNNAGKINPVTFEGQIQITNKNEFLNTVFKGIGPAKAFGCGLLLVKPI